MNTFWVPGFLEFPSLVGTRDNQLQNVLISEEKKIRLKTYCKCIQCIHKSQWVIPQDIIDVQIWTEKEIQLKKGALFQMRKGTIKLNTHQKLKLLDSYWFRDNYMWVSMAVVLLSPKWPFLEHLQTDSSHTATETHWWCYCGKNMQQEVGRWWTRVMCPPWHTVLSPQVTSLASFKELLFQNY